MNVRDLAVKFTSYAHYIASREWRREDARLPLLFCVAPDIGQKRRMQRVAQINLMTTPGCVLNTTTEELLHELGPLASIWSLDIPQPGKAVCPDGSLRHCLFDVIAGKKGT
jgi:hypothetical protein